MKILDIRDCTVGLDGDMRNALIDFSDHTVSLVAIISDQKRHGRPVVGYGFNSIGRFGQSGILRERLIPRLLSINIDELLCSDGSGLNPEAVASTTMLNEKPGGHGDRAGAVAALELAAWDLNAKLADEPAYQTISKYFKLNTTDKSADTYAAGGYYYPSDNGTKFVAELKGYLESGHHSVKIKVGGISLSEDMQRIEKALAVIGCGKRLAVDANGRFGLEEANQFAEAIDIYRLRWFEEPGNPLDFELNRQLALHFPIHIATGENLFSLSDFRNLIRYGGMRPNSDIFQMDPGLSYGLTEYQNMLKELESAGFKRQQCYPHGGHLINLHIAIGLGLGGCESYPAVFQPIGGYSPQTKLQNGRLTPSDAPGFGLEQKENLYPLLKSLSGLM